MLKLPSGAATAPIRVVLVEPYALVRAALREMVDREQDVEIVAEERSISSAIDALRDNPPDVILVDTEVESARLVAALQQLKRECPGSAIVLLGHRRDDTELFWAIQAGAAAHVSDVIRPGELIRVIRSVAAGQYLIDAEVAARPVVARRVLEAFREASQTGDVLIGDSPRRALTSLTKRETEVLSSIAEGMSNKDIAAALSISQYTVRNIVKHVLRKLAVSNRTSAVLLALRESWIPMPAQPHARPH